MLTAAAAAGAACLTVGAVLLQTDGASSQAEEAARPSGNPPLVLDLGVRADAEAQALRRAAELYERGSLRESRAIFAGFRTLDAQVGAAVARWPNGTVARLRELAAAKPRSSLVRLNLGLALFWAGRGDDAVAAWRAARRLEPDSLAAVRADDLLHPEYARGLPSFLPSFSAPEELDRLSAPEQVERLRRGAAGGSPRWKLLYGVALQRLGHPLSARREFDAAAALAPDDVDALVASAVGRFDKEHPEAAFSRLGPLAKRFPHAPSVRFHLGLLLLWSGQVEEARRQLELASSLGKGEKLGREADRLLRRLLKNRTS
jgi:tetratricopeptide (TPR) repeat protein